MPDYCHSREVENPVITHGYKTSDIQDRLAEDTIKISSRTVERIL